MKNELKNLAQHLKQQTGKPPLDLWHPELSGDIDIVIKANGDWFHDGSQIKRQSLIKLFSTILRREDDGDYYLLTPVEKWRIQVEQTALIIVDMDVVNVGQSDQKIIFTTNVDDQYTLSKKYPLTVLSFENSQQPVPIVSLEQKLTAKLTRSVFYRLADLTVEKKGRFFVVSEGLEFTLGGGQGVDFQGMP